MGEGSGLRVKSVVISSDIDQLSKRPRNEEEMAKKAKSEKVGAYVILHNYLRVLLDVVTCAALGDYILCHGSANSAIMAFAHQMCKNKRHCKAQKRADQNGEYEVLDQDEFELLERMQKSAFLTVGLVNEFSIPILLDADFCIVLGTLIKTNGTDDATIRRIGRRLLQAKEYDLKRNIKSVKSRRKKGESFKHIGEELGISAATASKYNRS
jgi:hypothetical protein